MANIANTEAQTELIINLTILECKCWKLGHVEMETVK